MTFTIDRARLSFSWFERVVTRLDEPACPGDWAWAGRSATWRSRFEAAIAGPLPDQPAPPWDPSDRRARRFWNWYGHHNPDAELKPRLAWERFVPMAVKLQAGLDQPGWRSIVVQGRIFPFGVGVVVNAEAADVALDEFVARCLALRRPAPVHRDGAPRPLDAVANDLLSLMVRRLADANREPDGQPNRSDRPFTVATIVQAGGRPPATPTGELQQLCTGHPHATPDPALRPLPLPEFVDGDLISAGPHGRAVWRPSLFSASKPTSDLGRLHRELTWMHLQVEALGWLLRFFASEDEERGAPSPVALAARHHASMLAEWLLADPHPEFVAPARSAVRHLLDLHRHAADRVRVQAGMAPITVPPWLAGYERG